MSKLWTASALALCAVCGFGVSGALAQGAPEFAGKTIRVVVGSSPGGSASSIAQILAQHMGKFIRGEPTLTPQYMPGAGGTVAMNYVFAVAPKDGTVIGIYAPAAITAEFLSPTEVKYKSAEINWLGRIVSYTGVLSVLKGAPATTIDEARNTELIIGATGRGSPAYQEPAMVNAVLNLKLKFVTGYKGGAEITLAMERGEVHGRVMASNAWEAQKPEWIKDDRLAHLVQIGPGDPKRMPNVPRLIDLAKTEQERALARFAEVAPRSGWGAYLPPAMKNDTVATLREAFKATLESAAFKNDVQKVLQTDVDPMYREDFDAFVADVMKTPTGTLSEIRRIYGLSE